MPYIKDLFVEEAKKALNSRGAPSDEQVKNAVNAYLQENPVSGGNVEYIETVELLEEATIMNDKLPRLKRMYFYITISETAVPTKYYVNLVVYRGSTRDIIYIPIEKQEATRKGFVDVAVVGSRTDAFQTNTVSSATQVTIQKSETIGTGPHTVDVFTKYHINVALPAGTKVEVYGVRA